MQDGAEAGSTGDAFLAEGAVVVGDVTLGPNSSVWQNAVLRGDCAPISVGAGRKL